MTTTASSSSSSSSSRFWPTYMNPENGALVPPMTTYTLTYIDPNNGALYPSTISSAVYGASPTSAGSGSGIQAVGQAYSSVSSSSAVMLSDVEGTGAAMYNSTLSIEDDDDYSSTPTVDSAASPSSSASSIDHHAPSPLKISVTVVPAVIGVVLIILGVWLCCRCRKRRRQRKQGGGYGEMMSEVERARQPVSSSISTTHPNRPFDQAPSSSLTRDEVRGIVSPRSRARDDRIDLIYPSRSQRAASASAPASASPLGPPPLSVYYYHQEPQPSSPAGTFGRVASRAPSSSRHSRWTDDTEYDVMAEDGSTITRTLSSTSTRRTIGADETSTQMGHSALMASSSSTENPFDHPAYTYRAAPQPQRTNTVLSRGTTLSASANGTWSSAQQPPPSSMTYNSTSSPISPRTPTTTTQYPAQPPIDSDADAYSIHSSEDGIFGNNLTLAPARTRRLGIRREPTIIRHADSSVSGLGRYSTTIERAGRGDAGVVELPPLYEDATSGWTR